MMEMSKWVVEHGRGDEMGVERLDRREGHARHVTLPHLLIPRRAAYLEISSKSSSREEGFNAACFLSMKIRKLKIKGSRDQV